MRRPSGVDRRAPTRPSARARRLDGARAATAQKRANEARKKYAEASAKTRVRPASARHPPKKTRAENEDTWKSIMRDLAAPENSKRRALAHEKLRKELDRHKKEWDKFERDFQKSRTRRGCRYRPWIGSHRSRVEPPRVRAPK